MTSAFTSVEGCVPVSTRASALPLCGLPPGAASPVVLSIVCSETHYASRACLVSCFQWLPDCGLCDWCFPGPCVLMGFFLILVIAGLVGWLLGPQTCRVWEITGDRSGGVMSIHTGGQLWGPIAGAGHLDLFLFIHEECLTVCLEGQQSLAESDGFWSQKAVTQTLDLPFTGWVTLARPLPAFEQWKFSHLCNVETDDTYLRLLPGPGEMMRVLERIVHLLLRTSRCCRVCDEQGGFVSQQLLSYADIVNQQLKWS